MSSMKMSLRRRGRPVSTKSCKTCKARRVKCDSMRPVCLRCIKGGLHCEGFTTIIEMSHPSDFLDGNDARQLQYFQDRVASEIFGFYDMQFWQQDIPLLAASHHELYHIMVAIGFLHENSSSPHIAAKQSTTYQKLALEHCNKAIRGLVTQKGESSSDKIAALASCLLFMAAEVFQNRIVAAVRHLKSGLAILSEWVRAFSETATRSEHNLMRAIAAVLYRFAESFETQVGSTINALAFLYQNQGQISPSVLILPDTFHGPTSASTYLQAIIKSIFQPRNKQNTSNQDQKPLLKMWRTRYRRLEETLAKQTKDLKVHRYMCFLNIQYLVVKILSETKDAISEIAYDEHVSTFQKIVQYCTQVVEIERRQAGSSKMIVSFDLGIIMPLYFTATRCRDHACRHEAVRLLLSNPRREGLWLSWATGRIAQRFIALEEAGLENLVFCADVPLERRVNLLEVRYEPTTVEAWNRQEDPWFTPQIYLTWKRFGADTAVEPTVSTVMLSGKQDDGPGVKAYIVILPRTGASDNCKMLIGRKSIRLVQAAKGVTSA